MSEGFGTNAASNTQLPAPELEADDDQGEAEEPDDDNADDWQKPSTSKRKSSS
jgi:hypothetical protein